jgi:hypothetical protein
MVPLSGDQLELISAVMIEQFGGMQGFVAAWGEYYRHAMEQGGLAAIRCFESVIRLIRYFDEKRPDPGDLTDEALEQAMMEQAMRLIQQRPEIAVAAAVEIGWTVIPDTKARQTEVA